MQMLPSMNQILPLIINSPILLFRVKMAKMFFLI